MGLFIYLFWWLVCFVLCTSRCLQTDYVVTDDLETLVLLPPQTPGIIGLIFLFPSKTVTIIIQLSASSKENLFLNIIQTLRETPMNDF